MTDRIEWGTSSLGIAASVLALGADYVRTDKTDHRRMVFYFAVPNDKAHIERYLGNFKFDFELVEREYTNGNLWVDAKRLVQAMQDLKSVIHSSK